MKRIHITRKGPLTFDKTRRYAVNRDRMLFKPAGLWYGIDDAWKEWCESESMDWIGGETYEVSLGKSNMLVLNTVNDIRQFTEEYNCNPFPNAPMAIDGYVDWLAVMAKYDGIEIPKYQWTCRLDPATFWYYCWDCASGCIWNLSQVQVRQVKSPCQPSESN